MKTVGARYLRLSLFARTLHEETLALMKRCHFGLSAFHRPLRHTSQTIAPLTISTSLFCSRDTQTWVGKFLQHCNIRKYQFARQTHWQESSKHWRPNVRSQGRQPGLSVFNASAPRRPTGRWVWLHDQSIGSVGERHQTNRPWQHRRRSRRAAKQSLLAGPCLPVQP